MKFLIKIIVMLVLVALCGYGYLFYQNNRAAQTVSHERIAQSYENSVAWLLAHHTEILNDGNPMLWWMLGESARISGDVRVQTLFDEFLHNRDLSAPHDVWQAFFHPEQFRNGMFSVSEYISLVEYQQYFLYTLTCSKQLAQEAFIEEQNDPSFCWSGPRIIRPACVTHQLMGYRMAQRNQCGIKNLNANIAVLQSTIEKQLHYDPRVVDVYLQRVLMLVDSGARDRVKPRWLERVLNAQLADGGWSNIQALIPVGSDKYFGFDATGVTIAQPMSNFHMTAQGVLLTSLLMNIDE